MSEPARRPPAHPGKPEASPRLESWKEIASYLGRSVRTVQRWEARADLPVYRLHERLGSVYAHSHELDAWWSEHGARLEHDDKHPAATVRGHRPWAAATLGAMAMVAVGLALLSLRPARPSGTLRLAVLPFENLSGDPAQEPFTDGVTEELLTQLAQPTSPRLAILARSSVIGYKKTGKALDQVGRELDADYILEGSVRRSAGRVRVTAQLIRVQDRIHLWAESYDRDAGDPVAAQVDVVRSIARQVTLRLSVEDRPAASPPAVDPEVREACLKGRLFLESPTKEQTRKAIESFEQAIRKDPASAPAYAGLARAYGAASNLLVRPSQAMPAAKAAALKALSLDSRLAEAYTARGLLRAAFDWDLPAAESDWRYALEIDPGEAQAHLYLGLGLLIQGRREEGVSEVERAHRQDPLSLKINARLGMVYALVGRHEQALRQCRKTLELDEHSAEARTCLGFVYERKGMYREALREYERAAELGYPAWPQIARASALAGRRTEAKRLLRRLQEDWRQGQARSPYAIAKVCDALGERDEVFAWLDKAYEEHDHTLIALAADPEWDPLRSDQRFTRLAQRIVPRPH